MVIWLLGFCFEQHCKLYSIHSSHRLVSGRRVNKVLNELEVSRFNLDVAFKVDGLEWCSISKENLFV